MKVDEQFKCKDCDNYNQCKYYHNRRETSFICKEFQNQWGYIEELEKIKAEIIENQCVSCGLTCIPYGDCKYFDCIEVKEVIECLELIIKHIEELKGERKTEKIDCNNTDCRNCLNHNACDYEYEPKGQNKSEQADTEFNHKAFYEYLLNVINPNEMEKYRSMFLSSGEIVN